jgi:hypothetical protein
MSATLIQKPGSSTPENRKLAHRPRSDGDRSTGERVTIDKLWPDALPFLWLAAIAGIIAYLVSGI